VSAKGNELLFEGPPEAVSKYISFIENLDLKDRAHKLSFRVWRMNDDSKQIKTTRKYNTGLQIARNTWAMLPFYEGEALLYLEVQAVSHQTD